MAVIAIELKIATRRVGKLPMSHSSWRSVYTPRFSDAALLQVSGCSWRKLKLIQIGGQVECQEAISTSTHMSLLWSSTSVRYPKMTNDATLTAGQLVKVHLSQDERQSSTHGLSAGCKVSVSPLTINRA